MSPEVALALASAIPVFILAMSVEMGRLTRSGKPDADGKFRRRFFAFIGFLYASGIFTMLILLVHANGRKQDSDTDWMLWAAAIASIVVLSISTVVMSVFRDLE